MKPDAVLPREDVALAELRPHPQNYRTHPDDQLEHLAASIEQFGFVRNIVIAKDGTILAGHGVAEAARRLGLEQVPAVRLDLDPDSPAALKLLAADNELGRFAEVDDRALTELLRQISTETPEGLLGTGYDEMALANLLMVTRTVGELADFDAAAEWVGMPGYEPEGDTWKLIIQFTSEGDRKRFLDEQEIGSLISFSKFSLRAVSGWWPPREVIHDSGLRWEDPARW